MRQDDKSIEIPAIGGMDCKNAVIGQSDKTNFFVKEKKTSAF